ncbi:MAG: helix-turn-helix domain-containing protein, partial [Brevefilum sp.]
SGGAGLTAGIGAGMGIGNALSGALNQQQQQQDQGSEKGGSGAGGAKLGAMPDVMTPDEAAEYLKVSAEDVVAAIEEGDLKARKLGKAYRISKEALKDFMNG